jgi:hypothetical protein
MAYSASANVASRPVRTPRADQFAQDIPPMIEEARATGCVTLQCLANYLNDNGAMTPRDNVRTPNTVRRVLVRVGAWR